MVSCFTIGSIKSFMLIYSNASPRSWELHLFVSICAVVVHLRTENVGLINMSMELFED